MGRSQESYDRDATSVRTESQSCVRSEYLLLFRISHDETNPWFRRLISLWEGTHFVMSLINPLLTIDCSHQ